MNINWKVRLKSKAFWVAIIPALLLLVQAVAVVFGFSLDFTKLSGQLIAVVDAIFVILVLLGIAVDPTTKGLSDSKLALTYDKPRDDRQKFADIDKAA